jgi:GAF domain-containing protein
MHDRDLNGQLDGFFETEPVPASETDQIPQPEDGLEPKKAPSVLEETLSDLLEPTPEPPAVEMGLEEFLPPLPEELLDHLHAPGEPVEEEITVAHPETTGPTWSTRVNEQRARILNFGLMVASVIGAVTIAALVGTSAGQPEKLTGLTPYLLGYAALVGITLAQRLDQKIRAALIAGLAFAAGILALFQSGPVGIGALYLLASPWALSMFFSRRVTLTVTGASIAAYSFFVVAFFMGWYQPETSADPTQLFSALILVGAFILVALGMMFAQSGLARALTSALLSAETERDEAVASHAVLKGQTDDLVESNASLHKRNLQLHTAAEVSRAATLHLDPEELLQVAVTMVKEQFDLYYAGLFLLDEVDLSAVLCAATGDPGRQMLEQGYRLQPDMDSVVGRSIVNSQTYIAQDVGDTATLFDNTLLPASRSEMAVPLRYHGDMIGVLDVHSETGMAFSEEDIPVFQMIADQMAIAIQNARSFSELQTLLTEMRQSQQQHLGERWADFGDAQSTLSYERSLPDAVGLESEQPYQPSRATAQTGILTAPSAAKDDEASLLVPITLRGESIGSLGLRGADGQRQWTADEIALIEAIADQMALAIENARLIEQTRQRAERERVIGDIGARVRGSLDPDTILKTTIRELSRALGAESAVIEVTGPDGGADEEQEMTPPQGEEVS